MTDASAANAPLQPSRATRAPVPALLPESFWGVLFRRSRYVVAIVIAAAIFSFIGWPFVAPPPAMAGVSLMAWSTGMGLVATLVLVVLVILVGIICTLLVHPDAPHMGLFCALAGMACLSIRGGTSHMLIQSAQMNGNWSNVSTLLAVECVQWAILFLIAEIAVRLAHDRFFANTRWITRAGGGSFTADQPVTAHHHRKPMGVSLSVSQTLGTSNIGAAMGVPLAMLYSGVVAYLLLYVVLQSQRKGQVLFACFIAFFLSTANAYLAFPRVRALAFFLVVPLTASVGYFLGSSHPLFIFPGQGSYFLSHALPIDFVVAGIPGAILGYYSAVRWSLSSHEAEA